MRRRRKSLNKHDLSSRRRRKKRGKGLFYVFAFGLLVVGVVFLMRINFWKITEVKVGETKRVNEAGILAIAKSQIAGTYFGVFPKNNFLIYPKEEIEKEIMDSEPAVLSVSVNAELDHTLTISIKERLASALWCKRASSCYFMDQSGIIFAPVENSENSDLLKYYGIVEGNPLGKQFGEKEFLSELSAFVAKIKALGLEAVEVEVIDKDKAQIDFKDVSFLMFLPFEKDKEQLFADIELFINDLRAKNGGAIPAFEYIDARYGNKIFYKIK